MCLAEGGMTADPQLLALLAQLRASAGSAAAAGLAPADAAAPLVFAQAAGIGGSGGGPDEGTAPDSASGGSSGMQALVPALWNLDRLDQAGPPLDGWFRCAGVLCQGPKIKCQAKLQRIHTDYCWRDAGLDAFQRALDGSNARILARALHVQ